MFGDSVGWHDRAKLEAVIERVWTSTSRQLMDGGAGAETLFIS